MTARSRLASRLTRDASIYAGGSFAVLLLGLANVAVLTRLLSPSEFGLLATALVLAELLPLLYNLGSLQGGMGLAFGASADEGEDVDDGSPGEKPGARESLGTALVLTGVVAAAGTALAALLAAPLALAVLGNAEADTAVRLAAAIGGMAALFRFASLVPRYEYRSILFAILHAGRVALALAGAVVLVALGHGVDGALGGALIGTTAATVVALTLTRRHYSFRVRWRLVPRIYRRGSVLVPVNLSFWMVRNADILLLAQFVRPRDVGVYRVASRAGGLMAFPISAFLMSWSTLSRQPLHAAVAKERGPEALAAGVVTYFVLGTTYVALALAVGAELLVRIAGPDFGEAAVLIPFVGLGFMAHGLHIATYRAARFPARRRAYVLTAVGSAVVFLAAALLLIPPYGTSGAVAASIAAPLTAAVVMFVLSQRGPNPVPFEYGRVGRGVAVAVALAAISAATDAATDGWPEVAVAAAVIVAYPLMLVATRVLTRGDVAFLLGLVRGTAPAPGRRREFEERLRGLGARDRSVLHAVVAQGRTFDDVGAELGTSADDAAAELTRALRRLRGAEGETARDADIARFLMSEAPIRDREAAGRALWRAGADADDVDQLTDVCRRVQKVRPSAWTPPHPEPAGDALA